MLRLILVLALLLSLSATGFSKTIFVPNDHATIQGAIQASENGDTIVVRPGEYLENLDFLGKAVTLTSELGPEFTTINGAHPLNPDFGSTVLFQNGEGADSVLQGFTIKQGTGTMVPGVGSFGGGICCVQSSPTIRNNILFKNYATADGGGIYCNDASPIIEKNTLSQNDSNRHGGGLACMNGSSPIIVRNKIYKNHSGSSNGMGWGGGIGCKHSAPMITGNEIYKNTADTAGGGIWCKTSKPTIHNNTIFSNLGTIRGGGVHINGYCESVTLTNNVICANVSLTGGGLNYSESTQAVVANNTICGNLAYAVGGGICCDDLISLNVTNMIVWMNDAMVGPEIWIGGGTALTMEYSDLRGGAGSVKVQPGSSFTMGNGMIDADPLFVNGIGMDFHIYHGSPCRDVGNATSQALPPDDFEGDPRASYGEVDMGADEFCTHLYYTGDATSGGYVEGYMVGLPDSAPVGILLGSGVLDPPVPSAFGPFFLQPPLIVYGSLGSIPSSGVLMQRARIPVALPVPLDLPLQAIIGDELTNLSVMEVR